MIFVTLGSQMFQFNRLLKRLDELIESKIIEEDVFAQIGYSDYKPQNYRFKQFLDNTEFDEMMRLSNIVITHGGTGAIIGAVKKGKKVIAVPRIAKWGEHVDDHQIQLLKQFDEMSIIAACYELDELEDYYKNIQNIKLGPYKSNSDTIINSIDEFLMF